MNLWLNLERREASEFLVRSFVGKSTAVLCKNQVRDETIYASSRESALIYIPDSVSFLKCKTRANSLQLPVRKQTQSMNSFQVLRYYNVVEEVGDFFWPTTCCKIDETEVGCNLHDA